MTFENSIVLGQFWGLIVSPDINMFRELTIQHYV